MTEPLIVECPHCQTKIEIIRNAINCAIYRHGSYKATGQQINPHLPKAICDLLITNNLIHGCGKPFRLIRDNDIYHAEICDYI